MSQLRTPVYVLAASGWPAASAPRVWVPSCCVTKHPNAQRLSTLIACWAWFVLPRSRAGTHGVSWGSSGVGLRWELGPHAPDTPCAPPRKWQLGVQRARGRRAPRGKAPLTPSALPPRAGAVFSFPVRVTPPGPLSSSSLLLPGAPQSQGAPPTARAVRVTAWPGSRFSPASPRGPTLLASLPGMECSGSRFSA